MAAAPYTVFCVRRVTFFPTWVINSAFGGHRQWLRIRRTSWRRREEEEGSFYSSLSSSVLVSAEGRVEHQKRNQTPVLYGRLVSFLVFNSITHVGKKVTRLTRKTLYGQNRVYNSYLIIDDEIQGEEFPLLAKYFYFFQWCRVHPKETSEKASVIVIGYRLVAQFISCPY